MSTTNKKAYVYKMDLVSANILGVVIFIFLLVITFLLGFSVDFGDNFFLFLGVMVLYLMLHEFLHGVGYFLGGTKHNSIQYGLCLEKGLMYCMAYQEVSKKNILISLQMPFMVIGVITYIIGIIFNLKLLVLLSIINLVGACMDLVMFIYILKLPKDTTYSESGESDEFVLISKEDLRKRKNLFFKIIDVKDYKKDDYKFGKIDKFKTTKTSNIVLGIIIGLIVVSLI